MEIAIPAATPAIARPAIGAGFTRRLGGQLIDLLLHNIVIAATGLISGLAIGVYAVLSGLPVEPFITRLEERVGIEYAFALVGYVVYHTVCEGLHGATLGKLILGMRVVQEDGNACSLGSAFVRSILFFIDQFFFGFVAYANMANSALHQRLGDKGAKTVVVERSKYPDLPWPSGWRFLGVFLAGVALDSLLTIIALSIKLVW